MRSILIPIRRLIHRATQAGLHIERRFEPFFRRRLNALVRAPLARLIQRLKNRRRENLGLDLAEEKIFDWEEEALQTIIDEMREQMNLHFQPGAYERGGNTKTHGLLKATFTVLPDLPDHLRHGVFATEREYPAYIRYAGPRTGCAGRYPRCRFRVDVRESDGCAGAKADGRREIHTGLARRRHPHFCHARCPRKCQAAILEHR